MHNGGIVSVARNSANAKPGKAAAFAHSAARAAFTSAAAAARTAGSAAGSGHGRGRHAAHTAHTARAASCAAFGACGRDRLHNALQIGVVNPVHDELFRLHDPRVDVAPVRLGIGNRLELIAQRAVVNRGNETVVHVRLHVVTVNVFNRRLFIFRIGVNREVSNAVSFGVRGDVYRPELLVQARNAERRHLVFLQKLIFFDLTPAAIHLFQKIGKVIRDKETVVFKEVRLADADRIAEFKFIFHKVAEFARKLARPTVTFLLVAVHELPRVEDVLRKNARFRFNSVNRRVVRMLRIAGNFVDALFCRRNSAGLLDVSLLNFAFHDKREGNGEDQY